MQTRNDRRLLANEGICLVTHPEVALILGKSEAIFLQQLHYWLTSTNEVGTIREGKRWIYNSYKAWAENLRIYSESTIRRAISKLERMGIILTQNLNKKKSDHTKWYTINYDVLKTLIPIDSPIKQKRGGEEAVNLLSKMSSPSVQNEHIINKENKNNFRNKILSYSSLLNKNHSQKTLNQSKQTSFEKDSFQQMILIWNQIVEEGQKTIELNSKRIGFLKKAFETKFESCFEKWKDFCKKIASSKFLMGEIKASFKASLDWVLKFDVMQRILEGDFGVGDRVVYGKETEEDSIITEVEIQNSSENQFIKQVREALLKQIGNAAYSSWFKNTQMQLENGHLIVNSDSRFAEDYIARVFLRDIEKVLTVFIPTGTVKIDSVL